MSLKKLRTALAVIAPKFVYVADKDDSWDVTMRGDCEDFSFATIHLVAGGGKLAFARSILFGPWRFWYVGVGPDYRKDGARINNGHFVTEHGPSGLMFDNNFKRLVERERMEASRYNFKKSYSRLRVLLKIALT